MVDETPTPPERGDLAAEFALGLLEGADRAEALRLCLADPAFAAEVEAWKLRLSPLLGDTAEAEPPAHLWDAVAARIGAATPAAPLLPRRPRLRTAGAFLAGALAASLVLAALFSPATAPPPPVASAISQLAGAGGMAPLAVAYDAGRGELRVAAGAPGANGRSAELWVIPADGIPRSLGLVPHRGGPLAVAPGLRGYLGSGVTLAITLEDPATAPHRAPSSAPVLSGRLTFI